MDNKEQQLLKRAIALIEHALSSDRARRLKETTGLICISVQTEEDMEAFLRDARSTGL